MNRVNEAQWRQFENQRIRSTGGDPLGSTSIIRSSRTKLAVLDNIELPREIVKTYSEFLRQGNTGLLMLSSEKDCRRILDVTNPQTRCFPNIPGSGRAFSFRKRNYVHSAFADLERSRENFVTPGVFVLGMIADLGDLPIDTVNKKGEVVSTLLDFQAGNEIEEVVQQERRVSEGLKLGDITYRRTLPIRENSTYLLRSIAYEVRFDDSDKSVDAKKLIAEDDRSDVVVVFRLIKQDANETLILLWKELSRKSVPRIKINSNSKSVSK